MPISINVVTLAQRAFGTAMPATVQEAKQAVDKAGLQPQEAELLLRQVADLPSLTALAGAMAPAADAAAGARASALGGKPAGRVQSPFDFPSKAQARDLGVQLGEALKQGCGNAPAPASLGKLPDLWESKDPQALKAWALDPKYFEAARLGAEFSFDNGSYWLVERGTLQNADASVWKQFLVKEGLINPLPDSWAGILEAAVFFLDAGAWCHDDQLDAGHKILGQPNAENDVWSGKLWSDADRERLAALISASGAHAYEDQGIQGDAGRAKILVDLVRAPDAAKAMIRARLASPCAWLDDPKEVAAFTDTLYVLKLADRSRGDAYRAAERGGDTQAGLRGQSSFRSGWSQTYLTARRGG